MLADLLLRYAAEERVEPIRADGDGRPRFVAALPDLDDLVRLAFEQIRVAAAAHPTVARRVIERLDEVAATAEEYGWDVGEVRRQQRLMRDAPVGQVPNDEDVRAVRAS